MVTLGIAGPQDCYNLAVHIANTRRNCCHTNANGKHRFPVAARRPEQASFPLSLIRLTCRILSHQPAFLCHSAQVIWIQGNKEKKMS